MKIDEKTLCWVFTGALTTKGYGCVTIRDGHRRYRNRRTHQIAYETWVGEIPSGLEIDHRCHNRACFNPDHLRAVDHRTNISNRRVHAV